jgi:hypothetical protein
VARALSHLQQADDGNFSHARLETELLLRLERFDDSAAVAQRWSQRPEATQQELGSLVDMLTDYGQGAAADRLLENALKQRAWTPQVRSDLLRRRAILQTGMARLRLLLEVATTLPTGTRERATALEAVVGELTQPHHTELAAQLATAAASTDVRATLLRRQAELTRRPAEALDIGWRLQAQGRLPAVRLPWLCSLANQAGQSDRVIRELETLLKQDVRLSDALLFELATAYRLSGRKQDARRASTHLLDHLPEETRPVPSGPRSSVQGGGFF